MADIHTGRCSCGEKRTNRNGAYRLMCGLRKSATAVSGSDA